MTGVGFDIADFEAFNERLIGQLEASETIGMVEAEVGGREEAVALIVSLSAGTFFAEVPRGREIQYLSAWHVMTRDRCTDLFDIAQKDNPDLDRDAINGLPDLQMLNGVRRGLHQAIKRNQSFFRKQKPKPFLPA